MEGGIWDEKLLLLTRVDQRDGGIQLKWWRDAGSLKPVLNLHCSFSILNVTYIKAASCFCSQPTTVVMATVSMALAVVATSGLRCGIVCGSSEAWCPWEMMA